MLIDTMKRNFLLASVFSLFVFSTYAEKKLDTKVAKVSFFSHTKVEDIKADNFSTTFNIDLETGEVKISVPMQSFEFEKALMQKHFNQKKFLHTKEYPKAKFIGSIDHFKKINLSRDGVYSGMLSGKLTIRGVTQNVSEKISFKVDIAQGIVKVNIKTSIILADYGILFEKGKPVTNIAKSVEIDVSSKYKI